MKSQTPTTDNSEIRFALYTMYTEKAHGFLGRSNRVRLPSCVESNIKHMYPNTDNQPFIGFHQRGEANERDEE